jgi:hypothetical protein
VRSHNSMARRSSRYGAALLTYCCGVLASSGCHPGDHAAEHRADWVIHSRLVFTAADLRTPRPAAPLASFRLSIPYVIGDLYGAPSTADFVQAEVAPDYSFVMDLNRGHASLLRSLEPTEFSLSYLHIAPKEARIARLAPAVLQADGIDPIGTAQWVDPASAWPLLLVYVDRPARITGQTLARGVPVRYDVRVEAAGYVWIAMRSEPGGGLDYEAVAPPQEVRLAVTPLHP